jgi:serine/threonine protein kinase
MIIGKPPFRDANSSKLHEKIINNNVNFPDRNKYDIKYSDKFVDIVKKLLTKDPKKRLGCGNDPYEILSHPFFNDIDLMAVNEKQYVPSYKPKV